MPKRRTSYRGSGRNAGIARRIANGAMRRIINGILKGVIMLNSSQIAVLINEIYDGVERSKLGEIISKREVSEKYPEGYCINHIPYTTFIAVINSLMPKDIIGTMKTLEE